MRRRLPRRRFLRGGASALISLPLLEAFGLRPERAYGQVGAPPKKYVTFIQPYGCFQPHFWPLLPGQTPLPFDTHFEEAMNDIDRTTWRTGRTALETTAFDLAPSLEPLAAHRQDLLILEGLNNPVPGHWGNAPLMTGVENLVTEVTTFGGGVSADQVIARAIGQQTRFASLETGWLAGDGTPQMASCTWYDAARPAAPQQDPLVLYQSLFSDLETKPDEMAALLADQRSVLDAALEQATELRAQLGSLDRQKVDLYLESFRDVERRLDVGSLGAACVKPAEPVLPPEVTVERAKAVLDLMAMAVACDLTRVATFQSSEGADAGAFRFPFLGGPDEEWHGMTHEFWPADGARSKKMADITHLYIGLYAHLIGRLKEYGAFENSVVLYMNVSSGIHNGGNHPVLIAGSLGGYFKQGAWVRLPFSLEDQRRTNDLHVTIMQGLGMDAQSFGDARWNRGRLDAVLV